LFTRPFEVKRFWTLLAASGLFTIVTYAALVALSLLDLPARQPYFDSAVAVSTQPGWGTEARYFMYNKYRFADAGNHVVIIGASTARDPFRPNRIAPALPGWQVTNASLSGAPVSEIADAVGLYYAERGADATGQRTIFVMALTYLQLRPPRYAPGSESPFASEAGRGGLYLRQNGVLRPQFAPPAEMAILAALRPQTVVASLSRRWWRSTWGNPDLPLLKQFADRFRARDPLSQWTEKIGSAHNLDALAVPPSVQQALLGQRLADTGGDRAPADSEVRHLNQLVRVIRSRGDDVVIVDLPLPLWHRHGVPVQDAAFSKAIDGLTSSGQAGYVSLRDLDADENFYDSGHAKPKMWPIMSERLAAFLQTIALQGDPVSQQKKNARR
jgi:hypothetical protein